MKTSSIEYHILTSKEALSLLESFETSYVITAFSDRKLLAYTPYLSDHLTPIPFQELIKQIIGSSSPVKPIASQTQIECNLANVLSKLEEGSSFYHSRHFPGFHKLVAKTLTEFHLHQIEFTSETDPYISQLKTIEEQLYLLLEEQGYETLSRRIHLCLKSNFQEIPCAFKKIIVLIGSEHIPLFNRWIEWGYQQGIELTIIADGISPHDYLFKRTQKTLKQLQTFTEIKIKSQSSWIEPLFSSKVSEKSPPKITYLTAPDPLSECEWILRHCLELIQKGAWPHHITLFHRQPNLYDPLLTTVANKFHLPISINRQIPLIQNPFLKIFVKFLKCLNHDCIHPCMDMLKNGYFQHFSKDEKEVEKMKNEFISFPHPISEWSHLLHDFITESQIPDVLSSQETTSERDLRALTCFFRVLNQYGTTQHRSYSYTEFLTLIEQILHNEETLQSSNKSGIQILSDPNALISTPHLFVLGMLEGSLPKRRTQNPLINDQLRNQTNADLPDYQHLHLSYDVAETERDLFAQLCITAQNQLFLSYPQTTDTQDNVPTYYLVALQQIIASNTIRFIDYSRSQITPDLDHCLAPSDLRIAKNLQASYLTFSDYPSKTDKFKTDVTQSSFSPEHLSTVLLCPLKAKLEYQLDCPGLNPYLLSLKVFSFAFGPELTTSPTLEEGSALLQKKIAYNVQNLSSNLPSWQKHLFESHSQKTASNLLQREKESRNLWHIKNAQVTTLQTVPLKHIIPIQGKKIQLESKEIAYSSTGSTSILHLKTLSQPDLQEPHDHLRFGLYFMSQYGLKPSLSLEIDSIGGKGKRTLYLLPRIDHFSRHLSTQLDVQEVSEVPSDFLKQTKVYLNTVIKKLEEGSLEALPSSYCSGCNYIEFCRKSIVSLLYNV